MELKPIARDHLAAWRKQYRAGLGIPVVPDFHEALCQMGQAYLVEDMGQKLGYVILAKETFIPTRSPMIPEFYLELKQTKYARKILESLLAELNPKTVMGRTDDTAGFPLLIDLRLSNDVASALYILDQPPHWVNDENLTILESTLDDAQNLYAIYSSVPPEDGGIPDEMALMKSLALWRHYQLSAGREILGVCYVVPQAEGYVTASPIMVESARGKGYGRYLMGYVAKREIAEGKTFVAATNPENEAGRGLVESLGARLAAHFMNFKP